MVRIVELTDIKYSSSIYSLFLASRSSQGNYTWVPVPYSTSHASLQILNSFRHEKRPLILTCVSYYSLSFAAR